jgi:hypothetical protein
MKTRILGAILLCVMGLSLVAADAAAIPAFARKYKFSCTTCHAPAPRLKAYGEEFAGNGFRVPDGAEPIRAYRDTGDELLTLQSDLPLAVRLDAWLSYENYDDTDDQTDLKTPWAVKLLSGGSIAPNVGYYFYFYASEHGEVVGLEDAYVHFNDLAGIPLDLMVGQFQISDPMMKRELRLSYEDYEVYRRAPGSSRARLTYDRGVMVTYDTPFGLGLVGEVVNGQGLEASSGGNYDSNRDKGYAGRATFEFGPVMVGGFYYGTSERIAGATNEVETYGPDASVAIGDFATLTAQYVLRNDSRPDPGLEDVDTDGLVAELVLQPAGPDARDHVVLIYNLVDSDDDTIDYETWTASWSHLHRRNLRMVAEFTWDTELEGLRTLVGFSAAF